MKRYDYRKLNKNKRDLVLSMVLGDGSLTYYTNYLGNKHYYLTVTHADKQRDFLEWKARELSSIFDKEIKVHNNQSFVKKLNKRYPQGLFRFGNRRFRAWRKMFYNGSSKDIAKISKFIKNQKLACTIWLMDDGTCQTGPNKSQPGKRGFVGFVLYLGKQTQQDAEAAQKLFKEAFGVVGRIKWQTHKYEGKEIQYPQLSFNVMDSLIIWNSIRDFVLQFDSMKHKFRYAEFRNNRSDLPQPPAHIEPVVY